MATVPPHALPRHDARARRWWVLAIAATVLLGGYVFGMRWLTQRVEADVDRSLQPLPTLLHDQPRA